MTTTVLYKYLGTNGVIESPVYLEGIYSTKTYILTADKGKILFNGAQKLEKVRCTKEEVSSWKEVYNKG